jgi:hypothetical protein
VDVVELSTTFSTSLTGKISRISLTGMSKFQAVLREFLINLNPTQGFDLYSIPKTTANARIPHSSNQLHRRMLHFQVSWNLV